jgi:hypothetical protein
LREERSLRVFENRVLSRIFWPKRDEVTGSGENYIMKRLVICHYPSLIVWVIKLRRVRCAGHVACMGERRDLYRVLMGKPEGKRPLERPRCRWEDNIKMDLKEVGCGVMDWIKLALDKININKN